VDERTGASLCPLYPLDKSKNAHGERRRLADCAQTTPLTPFTPTGMAPLLRQLIHEQTASGLPPAYVLKESE